MRSGNSKSHRCATRSSHASWQQVRDSDGADLLLPERQCDALCFAQNGSRVGTMDRAGIDLDLTIDQVDDPVGDATAAPVNGDATAAVGACPSVPRPPAREVSLT